MFTVYMFFVLAFVPVVVISALVLVDPFSFLYIKYTDSVALENCTLLARARGEDAGRIYKWRDAVSECNQSPSHAALWCARRSAWSRIIDSNAHRSEGARLDLSLGLHFFLRVMRRGCVTR